MVWSRLCALKHERHSIALGIGRAMTNAIFEMILNVSSRGPCLGALVIITDLVESESVHCTE